MKNKTKKTVKRPVAISIVSIIYYIGAAFAIIAAILSFIAMAYVSKFLEQIEVTLNLSPIEALGLSGITLFLVLGILFLALGLIEFFVARGLWKLKNWARIVATVLAAIGLVYGFSIGLTGIFEVIIDLAILVLLWVPASSRKVFKKT